MLNTLIFNKLFCKIKNSFVALCYKSKIVMSDVILDIKDIEGKISETQTQLTMLQERRKYLYDKKHEDVLGVKIGEDCLYKGEKARLSGFYSTHLWPIITYYKKDGTLGQRNKTVYRVDEIQKITNG